LFGEIHLLFHDLIPHFGVEDALSSWSGPSGTPQDFLLPKGAAIEVKTTKAVSPLVVRISSETQLDDSSFRQMYLHVIQVRERSESTCDADDSLPMLVARVRAQVQGRQSACIAFEDRLLEAGYVSCDEWRYESRFYHVEYGRWFQVQEGFPRVTPAMLPHGTGHVTYDLAVDACVPFELGVRPFISQTLDASAPSNGDNA
jgi:hypothetical protein